MVVDWWWLVAAVVVGYVVGFVHQHALAKRAYDHIRRTLVASLIGGVNDG